MSNQFDWVEDLLYTHLQTHVSAAKGVTAFKNLQFDASKHTLWIKAINTPASEYAATLGPSGENELVGFIQFGIYSELGKGTAPTKEIMKQINSAFKVPQRLHGVPEGCMLRLDRKDFSQGGQTSVSDFTKGGTEKAWDANYITVYWLAREPR